MIRFLIEVLFNKLQDILEIMLYLVTIGNMINNLFEILLIKQTLRLIQHNFLTHVYITSVYGIFRVPRARCYLLRKFNSRFINNNNNNKYFFEILLKSKISIYQNKLLDFAEKENNNS